MGHGFHGYVSHNQTVSLFRGTTCRIYRFQVENIHAPHYDVDGNPNFYWFEAWRKDEDVEATWRLIGGDWNHGIWWLSIYMHIYIIFIYGNFIIPTDELHDFSEGWRKNHQPVRITWHSSWRIWFGKMNQNLVARKNSLPSGYVKHSYWKWPSRNSWFTH